MAVENLKLYILSRFFKLKITYFAPIIFLSASMDADVTVPFRCAVHQNEPWVSAIHQVSFSTAAFWILWLFYVMFRVISSMYYHRLCRSLVKFCHEFQQFFMKISLAWVLPAFVSAGADRSKIVKIQYPWICVRMAWNSLARVTSVTEENHETSDGMRT